MTLRLRWWLSGGLIAALMLAFAAYAVQQHRAQAYNLAKAAAQREFAQSEQALAERTRVAASLLAESLVNPTYFFDLQRIGEVLGGSLARSDIAYVLLLDRDGRIIHDGSDDIARFGQRPDDVFAERAIAAMQTTVFTAERFVEVVHPIALGDQRLATLRLALKRGATTAAPIDVAAVPTWLDPLLLTTLAAAFVGLLALGDRRFLQPQLHSESRLRHLARVHAGGTTNDDARAALDRVELRFVGFERELQQLGRIDALTGLPNRIALRQRIGDAIQQAQAAGDGELALLFIDLDDFKRINDTLGHDVGDDILAAVAHRFAEVLHNAHARERGYIARFGGDEFVMLIGGPEARSRAGELAEQLLASLRVPLHVADQLLHVSASIGITSFPEDGADASRLIKNGDIAMYLAKVQGRNCVRYFTNYLTRLAEDRLAIEQDLRAALDRDELKLHYQPIIDLASGHIHGAEALLRWHHPTRGLVPTPLFVGIAEDVGLIDALGDFALRTACGTAARWPRSAGRAPFVSVNVSVKQLRDPRFPQRVAEVLADTGLTPERLHLELTESSLLDGESEAIAALEALHRLGLKLWLDDFGTGFSGLNHLRRVPVSGVKIDRSFVADLLSDRHDVALTSAIIAMARSLDITVVAEGVESAALAEILRQLQCPYGQGYWFGEPAHSERLVELVVAQRYGDRNQGNVVQIS